MAGLLLAGDNRLSVPPATQSRVTHRRANSLLLLTSVAGKRQQQILKINTNVMEQRLELDLHMCVYQMQFGACIDMSSLQSPRE